MHKLSPTQQNVVTCLEEQLQCGDVFTLWAGTGLGKTTMLAELHERLGGTLIGLKDVVDDLAHRDPLAIEEAFSEVVLDSLAHSDVVLVDDLSAIDNIIGPCACSYPREGLFLATLNVMCACAAQDHKKLIFACDGAAPRPVANRCLYSGLKQFDSHDYHFLCEVYLGEETAREMDFAEIYRFAPNLNGHQIKRACHHVKQNETVNTDAFVHYLLEHGMASNVTLDDVEKVDLADLKGIDDIIQELETHVVVPFEHDYLAKELDLQPKKGVLIYGPPGTGRTTVGKALAHRLKGKFFLIDGTFVSGTGDFHHEVRRIFRRARQNAPSVIFIDDSDVLWEGRKDTGFYRYLLTELDGLEGDSAGMVCVMMTAMDVSKLPPALLRSGRLEIWLEMPLPDREARREILDQWVGRLPESFGEVDTAKLVERTKGFTGADLRRMVGDAKNLYAYDRSKLKPMLEPTGYFLKAVDVLLDHRRRMTGEDRDEPEPSRRTAASAA